jgi:hypothetical protein
MKRSLIAAAVLAATSTTALCASGDLPPWLAQAQQLPALPAAPAPARQPTPADRKVCLAAFELMENQSVASQARDAALELARNRGCLR